MPPVTSRGSARQRSLDGLRGVAALVVVLGHVLPSVAAFSGPINGRYHATGWGWWFTNTPLAGLWDGSSAVFVFFVLSGFVLVVGRVRGLEAWAAYYPSRLLRLYLPVAGSVAIALALTVSVHQWTFMTPRTVLRDLALVRGVDQLNPPLWSLQWEVIFSLLLPVYVLFARVRRTLWLFKVVALLAVIALGYETGHVSLVCLPVFALGALLAVEHDRGTYRGWAERVVPARMHRWTVLFGVAAILAYTSRALVAAESEPGRGTLIVAGLLSIIGAAGLTGLALYCSPIRAILERPIVQWLGTRSFSLYLIHGPVLSTVLYLVGDAGAGTVSFIVLPLALAAAELFYRVIERPSHLLARRSGHAVRERASRADPARDELLVRDR